MMVRLYSLYFSKDSTILLNKGLSYTAGLLKRKNIIGQFDSDVVVLMKKAGAIMLAITNVPELCFWWETHNNIFGRSRNPYDTNRTVGGSSGGEVIY